MKKNDVYGYIRVSDTKQIDGASLSEQERAIIEYAKKNNLTIIKWFEETKTAAKRGRPKFTEMLKLLKNGEAGGVIIHKIDRSTRNLHDWASVGDLIDNGIQVHFAHESLDMTERGGRLSADIQAVMASDYVRNLRQETIKGLNGRLNQGLYPFKAPLGYLNNGKGKVKTKDPERHKHIKKLFELYVTEKYTVKEISEILFKDGLRNSANNKVTVKPLYKLLRKPFYIGLMEVKGRLYSGLHEPLISKELFQNAQDVIDGRYRVKNVKHDYMYRKMIRCAECKLLMSGEKQKGMVYYRCSTKKCPTKTRREDYITRVINDTFKSISLNKESSEKLLEILQGEKQKEKFNQMSKIQKIKLDKGKLNANQEKLLSAYLENIINEKEFQARKNKIIRELNELNQRELNFSKSQPLEEKVANFLELCKTLNIPYDSANKEEKRRLLKLTTSNLLVSKKSLYFSIKSPFRELYNCSIGLKCDLSADMTRKPHHKISHSDKPDIIIANEWTSQVKIPEIDKHKLISLIKYINEEIDYIPSLDEILYPNYQPINEND